MVSLAASAAGALSLVEANASNSLDGLAAHGHALFGFSSRTAVARRSASDFGRSCCTRAAVAGGAFGSRTAVAGGVFGSRTAAARGVLVVFFFF